MTAHSDVVEWLTKELADCEIAYRDGILVALIDALWLCDEMPAITPNWVLAAARKAIAKGLVRSAKGKRGRVGNPVAKYRADMVHFERWASVGYARRKQRGSPRSTTRQALGATWDDAYNWTSAYLRGTFAQGSAGAIKDSYQLVQREITAGNSSRFRTPLSPELQSMLK
jgi:hypothetical protein